MNVDKDKLWKGAVAAGGILVGILAIRYLFSESEDKKIDRLLNKDLKELGHVAKDSSGTIKVQDFIEMFKIISKYSKMKIRKFKRDNIYKRKQNIDNEETYKELISSQISEEEKIYQHFANIVMEYFGVDENEFLLAQQIHLTNPLFQKAMANIQKNADELEKFVPPISKEKAKEIFLFVEEQKFKTMENIMRKQAQGEVEASDTTMTLLIEHSRIEDIIYDKFGIEADDFTNWIEKYALKEDEDIKNQLIQNANSLNQN